jgi:hypothetical protein
MTYMPVFDRPPTPREQAYLEALAGGDMRPSISGQAGHMCRKFGWCEVFYRSPTGEELPRSALPLQMDSIAIVRAGYRAIGYVLTARGRGVLERV